jgi:hypothetical protein
MSNLAMALVRQGEISEGEEILKQVFDKMKLDLGENHPSTLITMTQLACTITGQLRYDEAEALHKLCLAKRKVLLGEDDPHTLDSMRNLAATYLHQGYLIFFLTH